MKLILEVEIIKFNSQGLIQLTDFYWISVATNTVPSITQTKQTPSSFSLSLNVKGNAYKEVKGHYKPLLSIF